VSGPCGAAAPLVCALCIAADLRTPEGPHADAVTVVMGYAVCDLHCAQLLSGELGDEVERVLRESFEIKRAEAATAHFDHKTAGQRP
jgi:hypothetical protein